MICSRRALLRLGTAGLVCGWASGTAAAEPIWTGTPDVDEFALLGDEIVTVGEYLRILEAATGRERRSARLRRPAHAEGPATVGAIPSAVVFGWYVWHEDVHVLCADPRSLALRWQRRIQISERERENVPRENAYVQSTFNNTLVTITDPDGNVLTTSSGGTAGFKVSRKSA